MITALLAKMQVALLVLFTSMTSLVASAPRRMARTRRGAEFIEVALYAAIILILAAIFRSQLRNAFDNLLSQIRDALNA